MVHDAIPCVSCVVQWRVVFVRCQHTAGRFSCVSTVSVECAHVTEGGCVPAVPNGHWSVACCLTAAPLPATPPG